MISLVTEVVLSCVELLLLVFGIVHVQQGNTGSSGSVVAAIIFNFLGVGIVAILELARMITLAGALHQRSHKKSPAERGGQQ